MLKAGSADEAACALSAEFWRASATATKEELAQGLNLATVPGPITTQAQEVLARIFKKGEVGSKLWSVQLRPQLAAQKPGLEAQSAELEAQISAACQTKPHHFELKPSPAAPGRN